MQRKIRQEWAIFRARSSNKNFSSSDCQGIPQIWVWLLKIFRETFKGRVILIYSQIDVFSTNIDTFISFFELCRGLDIWIFWAHDNSRHIMLDLNKLQGKEISDDRVFIDDRIFIDAGNCPQQQPPEY